MGISARAMGIQKDLKYWKILGFNIIVKAEGLNLNLETKAKNYFDLITDFNTLLSMQMLENNQRRNMETIHK